VNGLFGSANAQAQKAIADATISQSGKLENESGKFLPASFILVAYTSQNTTGVATRKIQKAIYSAFSIGFGELSRAARTAT